MKKFIFSSLFLLATVFAFGSVARAQYNPTFTITKPSNLETWEKGQSYEVRWKTNGNVSPEALIRVRLYTLDSSGEKGRLVANLISVQDNNYCVNSNFAQVDCVKVGEGKASVYLRDNIASGKYNLSLDCNLNGNECDFADSRWIYRTINIVASSSVPQLNLYPVSVSGPVNSGEKSALLASFMLDASKSPFDVRFYDFVMRPISYSSTSEPVASNGSEYLSNCGFYIEKNKIAKGQTGNPFNDFVYSIYESRSQTNHITINRGTKEKVDFRCDISDNVQYIKGYYGYRFSPVYSNMLFKSTYKNQEYSQGVGVVDETYVPEVRLLTSPKEKPSKNGTLSIKALPETLTSGSNTMISYTTNANASTTLLNLICPDGVSARWIEGKNREMCNTKVTLSRVLTPITLNVTNTSASDKEISVNFYEYLLNNIDYAIGSSTKITVKPLVVNNGVKSLDIINPQGGVMHMADSDLYVDWQANNLNVDHYYVLLQNELVNDVGLIVGDNITSTSSYLSYHFNLSKKVIDQMVKQSNGLTEGQLQNHYYVTVVAANRGFFGGSKPEYFAKSKVFYIGPTSGVMANNITSNATPIQDYRGTNSYKYEISFDLYNSSSSPVYVNKNMNGDALDYEITPAQASSSRATIDSIGMAGDSATYYYLMPGITRKFYVYGVITNGGPSGLIKFVLKNIKARTEYSKFDNLVVDLDQNQTKLFMSVDGLVMNNTATSSSSSIIVGAPTIIGGNKVISYPVEIKFNIVAQDSPIYISNLINGKTPLVFSDSEGYVIPQMNSVEMSPRDITGDGILYKIIPAGTTRSFTFRGMVRNSGLKYSNNRIIQVKAIKYGLSSDTVDSEFVNTNYSNLKALVYLSEDYNATTTSEAYDPKSVYIKDGFSRTLKILTSNDYKVIGNNFDLFAYIVNINDYPIYLRNKNDGADFVTGLDPAWAKADVSVSFGNRSSSDPSGYVVINPKSERLIYIKGDLYNNEYNGNVKYSVKSLMYGTTTSRLERSINDGLSYLSYSVPFDSASSTLYSSSAVLNQKINSLSTYSGLPGTSVIAYGQDFCRLVKNVVTFTSDRYDITDDKAVLSGDGKSIRFTVPNMPFGTYKVFVDSKGASWNSPKCNPSNYLNFTIGTSTPVYSPTPVASASVAPRSSATPSPSIAATTSLPYITSISPNRGGENANVTVYGRNLSNITSVQFYDRNGYPVRGLVPSYVSAQSVSFRITNEFATSLASGVYSLSLVSSNCRGGCDSNRINFELISTAQASVSPSPSTSATRTPTPYPSASNTPYPSASNTPTPTHSSTPVPTSGATPTPAISSTPLVSPTPVTSSTPTPTPVSSATPTPASSATPTPSASSSATPTPSASSTPRPSTSASPSPSSSPTAYGNELFRASVWVALKSIFGI